MSELKGKIEEVELDSGKYKVILQNDPFMFKCLRYGEEWKDLEGDNLSLALMAEILKLRKVANKLSNLRFKILNIAIAEEKEEDKLMEQLERLDERMISLYEILFEEDRANLDKHLEELKEIQDEIKKNEYELKISIDISTKLRDILKEEEVKENIINEIVKTKGKLLIYDNGEIGFYCAACKAVHKIDDKWGFDNDFENPTISESVYTVYGEGDSICHLILKKGKIQYLLDSTHELSGQVIDLSTAEY